MAASWPFCLPVDQALTLWPDDQEEEEPQFGTLLFDPADPYAVHLAVGSAPVVYTFERTLLVEALFQATLSPDDSFDEALSRTLGEGDMLLGPSDEDPWLTLTLFPEPDRHLAYRTARSVLNDFTSRIVRMVPFGQAQRLAKEALTAWLQEVAR
ncbi:SsgA family sporulation/cell division regulator [Nonomuraea sp. NPDC026600]|uniref:SsgA family sporulation/cell division regulator n=1 Tax=Nonomuraea sp. NPDC026600 TaxID=3155363 RepID=UPI0033F362BE